MNYPFKEWPLSLQLGRCKRLSTIQKEHMTPRQHKQQAVKQSILLRRQKETAQAIAKNGGPITDKQIKEKQVAQQMRRAIYGHSKSLGHHIAAAILEKHPMAEYQGND